MNFVTLIGFIAGSITMFSFLPQVIKIVKTKSAHDVSIEMALLVLTGAVLWTSYGFLIHSLPVIIANVVNFIFVFVMVILKFKYK